MKSSASDITCQKERTTSGDPVASDPVFGDPVPSGAAPGEARAPEHTEKHLERELLGAQRFSDDIVNSLPGVYYLFDEHGKMLRWNENLERMTHYTTSEIALMNSLEFFRAEQQAEVISAIQTALTEGSAVIEAELIARGGHATPCLLSAKRLVIDAQVCLVGTATDLSERKKAEADLAESEQKFRQLAEHIDAVFWVSDLDKDEMAYISPAYETVWGRTRESLYAAPISFVEAIHPEDRERVVEAFALQIRNEYDETYRVVRPDGGLRWVRDRAFPILDANGSPYRIVGFAEDITELKGTSEKLEAANRELEQRVAARTAELARANRRLQHDAFHDALTGLPNRALFTNRLEHALERERRNSKDTFAVFFLDFDRFKVINDSLGHTVGDALLVAVGERLRACVRPADTVARLGGDEFTLLAPEVAGAPEALVIAERLKAAFARPFYVQGQELHISASIGVALSEVGYSRASELLRDADTAMYRAKAQGKGAHAMFDASMRERALALIALESDLRLALKRDELRVHYQPIISAHGETLAGFEALVRWQHPERGLVSPGEFIPVAEDTGLIADIDRFVLRTASQQIVRWQTQLGADLKLSANLSSVSFAHADLALYVSKVLRDTGLAPQHLKLEITESLLVGSSPMVSETLADLRTLGVALHIDDFGTGYSSLSYLKRFSAHHAQD